MQNALCTNKRCPFTILEIMLAILILMTAAGFTGWKVKSLLDRHHFDGEAHRLYHEIEMAQLFALMLRSEITLDFSKIGDHWEIKFGTEERTLQRWKSGVISLQHVEKVEFKGMEEARQHHFVIDSQGRVLPEKASILLASQDHFFSIDISNPIIIKTP